MNNYAESKQKLDAIRREYGCKGEIIFRTAIQYIVEHGQYNFRDETWFDECINYVDERHDLAEKYGKWMFMTRDFEKALLECARELARIEAYDLLTYIQREVWLGGGPVGEPDYQRAIELVRKCMGWIETDSPTAADLYDTLANYCDFDDNEIDYFGFRYLFDIVGD